VTPAPDALTVLVDALDGFAGALESGRADVVLAAEEQLASAVSGLRTADLKTLALDPHTRLRVDDARLNISRCRAMGAASAGLLALGSLPTYGRRGLTSHPDSSAVPVASRT
jgi:hypothetical protein